MITQFEYLYLGIFINITSGLVFTSTNDNGKQHQDLFQIQG